MSRAGGSGATCGLHGRVGNRKSARARRTRRHARAMLAAMREPALLHGERIEAVNDAFATLVGIPADQIWSGKTLADLVSARIRGARGARSHARARGRGRPGARGGRTRGFRTARSRGSSSRRLRHRSGRPPLVLFTAEEMLPRREGEGADGAPERSQLALDSLGEGLLTTDAHGLIDYINPSGRTPDRNPARGRDRTGVRRDDRIRRRTRPPRAAGSRCSNASAPAAA